MSITCIYNIYNIHSTQQKLTKQIRLKSIYSQYPRFIKEFYVYTSIRYIRVQLICNLSSPPAVGTYLKLIPS